MNSTSVFCLLHITRINKASHLLRWCHGPFDSGTECWPQLVKFSYQEQCCSLRFDFSTPASLICIVWIHDVLRVFVSTVLSQRVRILCSKLCTSYIYIYRFRVCEVSWDPGRWGPLAGNERCSHDCCRQWGKMYRGWRKILDSTQKNTQREGGVDQLVDQCIF